MINMVDTETGEVERSWPCARVNDLVITNDAKYMIVVCQEKRIRFFNLLESRQEYYIQEHHALTSLTLSKDSRYCLINVSTQSTPYVGIYPVQEIQLYDVERRILVQKYTGQKQGRFVIRSCFGGANESFILSGSEDSMLYMWHLRSGTLLHTLGGHSGPVNCVDWSPSNPYLFVSASDDGSVRVWTKEKKVLKRRRDLYESQ